MQKLASIFYTGLVLPGDTARALMTIPPLKNALKLQYLKELQEQSKGLCKKKENPSILRVGSNSYQELVSFKWAKLLLEWEERAPDVLDAVTAVAVPDNAFSQSKNADALIPPICTALSTLLNGRNAELSLVQKLVTVVIGLGGCSKMVCNLQISDSFYCFKKEQFPYQPLDQSNRATGYSRQGVQDYGRSVPFCDGKQEGQVAFALLSKARSFS